MPQTRKHTAKTAKRLKINPSGRLKHALMAVFLATALPVLILRWVPPPASMFMIIAQCSAIIQGDDDFRLQYDWTPWEDISKHAKLAVVAAEDQTFADHLGFDFKAMRKAMISNQHSKKVRGASTLSQQTAKNLFLYPGRSYLRKVIEAYMTALVELSWPKQRILEVYLNVAEFGKGIYGVEAASQAYFQKSAAQLSAQEAALLAAVLPNPILLRADQPSAYVQRRQQWIANQMRRLGGEHYLNDL